MASISWLHITDLHQGIANQEWLWPSLKSEFYKDLERVIKKSGAWDLVIFTGDLTQTGSRTEFEGLSKTLRDLWDVFVSLGIAPSLVAIPGNHDLVRPNKLDPHVKVLSRLWHTDPDIAKEFWTNPESDYRRITNDAFHNFLTWWSELDIPKLPVKAGLLPGDISYVLEKAGLRLGVVGLNTAFLQLTDDDHEGKLDISERQLHAVCDGDATTWCSSNHINLLLTHHPVEWLTLPARDRFRAEIYPPGRFLAHLCGHLHAPLVKAISEGGAPTRRLLEARSLYGLKYYTARKRKVERLHGYIVARVELKGNNGTLLLWPREHRISLAGHLKMAPDYSFELDDNESMTETFVLQLPPTRLPSRELPILAPDRDVAVDERISDHNLIEAPPDTKQAEVKLKGVPRWPLRPAPQHNVVRLPEQQAFKEALLADRAVWLVADWGLGKEGFLFSTLRTENDQRLEVFRLNCEDVSSAEEITQETQKQFRLTFQEFCLYLSALPSSCLLLDNLPEPTSALEKDRWFQRLDEIVHAITDLTPTIKLVLTSRRPPIGQSTASRFSVVPLRPLDEPECARYIEAHPDGGPGLLGPRGLERLYAKSQGVPMHLDRMLRELHTISIDELSVLEQEGEIESPGTEPIPRALIQAVALLQHSTDKYTKRSLRLLKVLTVLSQGETFETLRRFDPAEPLYPDNVEQLRALGLIETVPLVTAGPQFGQSGTIAGVDAASPKLLVVPRQIRDYVNSVMPEDERPAIVERALDIYFGLQWREGAPSLPAASKLWVCEVITTTGAGNPHLLTLFMLRDSINRADKVLFQQVFRLVHAYLTALSDADRYRDVYTASQEVFQLLENAGAKTEAAQAAALYGESLRMLGHHEESVPILEKALEYAPPTFGKNWEASIYLDLALAHQRLGDKPAAITAAKAVLERAAADSGNAYQAKSIILRCEPGEDLDSETFTKLADLEQTTRKKGHFVVANNIALELANETNDNAMRTRLRQRVLEVKEDVYNRIRAIIAKSEELVEEGRQYEITAQERRFLSEAYSYLYSQRLRGLFDRCHKVLWEIGSADGRIPVLLRLFRFSSFLWRVYGRLKQEKEYLRKLRLVCSPDEVGSVRTERDEIAYYLVRLRAINE